ncbi:MAG: TMEM43 family protein [Geminicoccaceae bacterium]
MARRKRVSAFVLGLMLIAGSVGGLFYNEMRSAGRIDALSEAEDSVISIQSGAVNPAAAGRLVHLVGAPRITGLATDPQFAVETEALRLDRRIEMYQWREHSEGSGEERQTTYEKVWSQELISSDGFIRRQGHANPQAMPVASASFFPEAVEVGRYDVSPPVLAFMEADRSKTPDEPRDVAGLELRPHRGFLQSGTPGEPQVGDIRASLVAAMADTVTVLGRAEGGSIVPWTASNGSGLTVMRAGAIDAGQLIDEEYSANRKLTWGLRGALALAIFAGMMIIIRRLARTVPVIGALAANLLGPIAFVLALAIALVTIALGWLAFRPMLSLVLLGTAVVLVIALRWMRAPTPEASFAHAARPPPPPSGTRTPPPPPH